MRIHELPSISGAEAADYLPVDHSDATYKTSFSDLLAKIVATNVGSTLIDYSGTTQQIKTAFSKVSSAITSLTSRAAALENRTAYSANQSEQIGTAAARIMMNGFLTGGSTSVYMTVTTPLLTSDVSHVQVTAMTGRLRGVQGPLNNMTEDVNFYSSSAYTITAYICARNAVSIVLVRNAEFTNAVNNTPINYHGFITLKFT